MKVYMCIGPKPTANQNTPEPHGRNQKPAMVPRGLVFLLEVPAPPGVVSYSEAAFISEELITPWDPLPRGPVFLLEKPPLRSCFPPKKKCLISYRGPSPVSLLEADVTLAPTPFLNAFKPT